MSTTLTATDHHPLLDAYRNVRAATLSICEPLAAEDMVVQTMPDVSPTKWHLAHATWFFETVILARHLPGYELFDSSYHELFNSYYQSLGKPFPRSQRGLLSRPTVDEVLEYRRHVDDAMVRLLSNPSQEVAELVQVGVNHEQQHQELMLMDILHVFAQNPLHPIYRKGRVPLRRDASRSWIPFGGGEVAIGFGGDGFCYDNEQPRHQVQIEPFEIASHLVTNGQWLAFLEDGGYGRPELWLADGFELNQKEGIEAPLYWQRDGEGWQHMTLHGMRAVDPDEPVCHVSFYEADAFARWSHCRLPTEPEWELAAASGSSSFKQRDDHAWQWTSSPYSAYPGFQPFAGSLAEYNGKFMINQFVLRGGCHATPEGHSRTSYRNFYHPQQRWMFAGLRLARDVQG